jgi:hypothetical protein
MKRFLVPLLSVALGIATSQGLQLAGVAPLWAKVAGLAVVLAVIVADWQRKARV